MTIRARPFAISIALVGGIAITAFAGGIHEAAEVSMRATRGVAFRSTDTLPPPPGCDRVVVIGDSLTDNSEPWLRAELQSAGHEFFLDAQPSRRIPARVEAPYSGVRAALAARAAFGDADCWMIALGSNDLVYGGGDVRTAYELVDEMLGSVSDGASVWWVNVNYRRDPRTSFDFVAATTTFNAVLADRAAVDPDLHVVDWYAASEAHPEWFFDPVHVDRAGSIVRAELTVAELPPAR